MNTNITENRTKYIEQEEYDFLKTLKSPYADENFIVRLYEHLLENSELSREAIRHELETGLGRLNMGRHFFLSLDIEEISFLISHNLYQEKDTGNVDGRYPDIDVSGKVNDKYLFLVSDTKNLVKKTIETIQDMYRDNDDLIFRFACHAILSKPEAGDLRRLYILEEESAECSAAPSCVEAALRLKKSGILSDSENEDAEFQEFLYSSSERFIATGLAKPDARDLLSYFKSWKKYQEQLEKDEEIFISVQDHFDAKGKEIIEKEFELWMPREKFQENFVTINQIFERRGIHFACQNLEHFIIDEKSYVSLNTFVDASLVSDEVEEFLKTELYNRIILLKSAPVSVGEIRKILDQVKTSRDYVKLDLIEVMQKNKQREYLIPLVLMLNDANRDIRFRAFGLIKHYLFNPTERMKNDYYWSTLRNIFSAATVPIEREKDRPARPLTDDEIIQLIRFRDIYYDDFTEPVTGESFLFIRMNGIGIGKGGIRQDVSHVSFSGEGALSTNMLFKTLGIGIPKYTTGKGGILGDVSFSELPSGKKETPWRNVFNAYADFLYYQSGVGPLSDVPAGDVGVGADEIGVMYNRITDNAWKDIKNIAGGSLSQDDHEAIILRENFGLDTGSNELIKQLAADRDRVEGYTASAITGKPGNRGLPLRTGATGRGLVEVLAAQQNYHEYSDSSLWSDQSRVAEAFAEDSRYTERAYSRMKMLTFAVQGFGKVGASFTELLDNAGAPFKMISDVSGTIVNDQGIPNLQEYTSRCKSGKFHLSDIPPEILGDSKFLSNDTIAPLHGSTNVVVPCALEDVITTGEKLDNSHVNVRDFDGDYLLQGANGPATADAEEVLSGMGIVSFPDILANAGGVLASYLEWLNGMIQSFGYRFLYERGFVHAIVHNLILNRYPDCMEGELFDVDKELYAPAFRFILREATIATIRLSRTYKISMRTAFMALGIRCAAAEGRLSSQFAMQVGELREKFINDF